MWRFPIRPSLIRQAWPGRASLALIARTSATARPQGRRHHRPGGAAAIKRTCHCNQDISEQREGFVVLFCPAQMPYPDLLQLRCKQGRLTVFEKWQVRDGSLASAPPATRYAFRRASVPSEAHAFFDPAAPVLPCSALRFDRTKPSICSTVQLVPFQASLNGTSNSARRRFERPHLLGKCDAPNFRAISDAGQGWLASLTPTAVGPPASTPCRGHGR